MGTTVISLNSAYEKDEIFYYCNACGEIQIPNDPGMAFHSADELPAPYRDLYSKYQTDASHFPRYVIRYKGNAAMAISVLLDECFCSDIVGRAASGKDLQLYWNVIQRYAAFLRSDLMLDGCDILIGHNTDPDGNEILIVVPPEVCPRLDLISGYLNRNIYLGIENWLIKIEAEKAAHQFSPCATCQQEVCSNCELFTLREKVAAQ